MRLFRNQENEIEIRFRDKSIPELSWHYGPECISSKVFDLLQDEFVEWQALRKTYLPTISAYHNFDYEKSCGRSPGKQLTIIEIELLLNVNGLLTTPERDDLIANVEKKKKRLSKIERSERPTRIYLMRDERTGFHKIGYSDNPRARERTLQSDNPLVVLVGSWDGQRKIESDLHSAFASKRVRGEWFNLTAEEVLLIGQVMNQ